jgi:pimeloyl-ACP methyl ester carboxylesterase
MPRATVNGGIELEYETIGSPEDPTFLLIMGLTAQLIHWPDGFCDQLVGRGYHVVRFDNRDSGLSTKFEGIQVDLGSLLTAALSGQPPPADAPPPDVPYTLSDMAADALGLLDHLGIDRAHVVGASMGGMIAQQLAIEHPERVSSLVSIMSMSGEFDYGKPDPEAAQLLFTPPPTDRDAYIARAADGAVISSTRYFDLAQAEEFAARSYDRSFYPEGAARQLGAVYASGPRTTTLPEIKAPTLVIHGRDDRLITPSGGQRTAELIPGASYFLVADMGHDLPEPLWPVFVDAIAGHAAYASTQV